MDAKAKALKAAGRPVIGFGAGEPDFATPDYIVEAAVAACRDPVNHRYTPAGGLPAARSRRSWPRPPATRHLVVEPSQVLVTNGGKQAVYEAFATLARSRRRGAAPGAVLDHVPRGDSPGRRRTRSRWSPTRRQDYLVTRRPARGRPARTARRCCSSAPRPTRPARCTRPSRSRRSGGGRVEHDLWVVTDEIYEHLTYDGADGGLDAGRRARARRHAAWWSTAWPRPTR
ncbi:MAG: hypothetical protein WKF83_16300 [Nocardioidaceae bacterium]